MQISHNLLAIFIICVALFCAGCTQPASQATIVPVPGSVPSVNPSQLSLAQSEVPQGFILTESRSKNSSDMSRLALELGWQGGQVVRYTLPAQNSEGAYEIIHSIAVYPAKTIPDVIRYSDQRGHSDNDFVYTDPAVHGPGDNARVFSGTISAPLPLNTTVDNPIIAGPENQNGPKEMKTNFSEILFSKGNTFEDIKITGTFPDTALLINLSQKAYSKIP